MRRIPASAVLERSPNGLGLLRQDLQAGGELLQSLGGPPAQGGDGQSHGASCDLPGVPAAAGFGDGETGGLQGPDGLGLQPDRGPVIRVVPWSVGAMGSLLVGKR